MIAVNYLAILACGIVSMILGSLWYGPVFGKPWAAMMGFTPEMMAKMKADPVGKKKMMRSYGLMFVGSLLMAWVLSYSVPFAESYLKMTALNAGIQSAFWSWVGFIAPATIGTVLWENKPWKLWMLNSGYYLVQLVVMGVILALWK